MRLTSVLMCAVLLLCPNVIAQDGVLAIEKIPPQTELICEVKEEPGLVQSLVCKTTLHGTMTFTVLSENGQTTLLDTAKWTADMGILMLPSKAMIIVEFVDIYGRLTSKIHQVSNVIGDRS